MHNCKSSTTLSTRPRRAVTLLHGTTLWMHRICANSFQAAVKPQSNCIKDQSKQKKIQKYFFQVEHQVLLWEHFQWSKKGYWEASLTASSHTFCSTDYLLSWVQPTLRVKKNKDLDLDLPLQALSPLGYRRTTTVFTCLHFLKRHNILHIYVWLKELLNPGQISE